MRAASGDATVRKVMARLLPLSIAMLFFNLIDRTNISFAALEMNADLGFTPSVYGVAAGIFFIGYFLFEVPSNLLLVRVGARPWLARIMLSWGVVVIGMAFVQSVGSFYVLRFLLGVAEAGLFPGVLLYLSRWIPGKELGVAYAYLMSTTALANVMSGPIATGLMQLDGTGGLQGWQLMFILEGLATLILAIAVLRYLPERPRDARWLEPIEQRWLATTIALEQQDKKAHGVTTLRQGFLDRRVLIATLVCFLFVCCNFGTVFWLPQIIRSWGSLSTLEIGFATAIPYLLGGAATILWARHSDRTHDRKWHLVGGALVGAVGYGCAARISDPIGAFAALCVATIGIWSMFGVFWGYTGNLLGGAAAAGGFAFVNSFATLGGFVGPALMGFVREKTQSFSASLLILAGLAVSTAVAATLIANPQRQLSENEPGVDGQNLAGER